MQFSEIKNRILSSKAIPFICLFIPFVSFKKTLVIPFICKIIPFVINQKTIIELLILAVFGIATAKIGRNEASARLRILTSRRSVQTINNFDTGFTLVELAITLTIVGILAVIAAPAYQNFMESGRLTTATNEFVANLSLARVEAMKRQRGNDPNPAIRGQVIICSSSDSATCTGTSWQTGWIVFWDAQGDGNFTAGTDTLLKMHSALPSSITTAANPAGALKLTFSTMGIPSAISSLQITNTKLNQSRLICFTTAGRAQILENASACP